jgi:hypothetical protein
MDCLRPPYLGDFTKIWGGKDRYGKFKYQRELDERRGD